MFYFNLHSVYQRFLVVKLMWWHCPVLNSKLSVVNFFLILATYTCSIEYNNIGVVDLFLGNGKKEYLELLPQEKEHWNKYNVKEFLFTCILYKYMPCTCIFLQWNVHFYGSVYKSIYYFIVICIMFKRIMILEFFLIYIF